MKWRPFRPLFLLKAATKLSEIELLGATGVMASFTPQDVIKILTFRKFLYLFLCLWHWDHKTFKKAAMAMLMWQLSEEAVITATTSRYQATDGYQDPPLVSRSQTRAGLRVRFAWLELKLALFICLRRFNLKRTSCNEIDSSPAAREARPESVHEPCGV